MLTWLSTHGVALLAGATTVLGLGALAMAAHRDRPLHRKRLGELTLAAALVWVAGAWLPLPRWELPFRIDEPGPATPLRLDARFDPAAGALARGLQGAPSSEPLAAAEERVPRPGRPGAVTPPTGSAPPHAVDALADSADDSTPATGLGGGLATGDGPGADPTSQPTSSWPGSTDQRTTAGIDDAAFGAGRHSGALSAALADDTTASSASVEGEQLASARAADTRTLGAAPAAAPTAVRDAPPSWLARHGAELAALVFLVGAGACLAWLCLGWWRLRRVLAATEPAPVDLSVLLRELDAGDLRVRVLAGRTGPFCVGLRRPLIVLPAALVRGGDRRTLAHVLAHEIAHARHGDGLGRLLCALTLPVFWCHPLYWWLRRDLTLSAELLADERAARLSGRRHYARDLLSLASTTLASGRVPAGARSIFGNPSEFTRRIDMLLRRHGPLATRLSPTRQALHGLAATAVTAGALMLFGATPAAAQSADSEAALQRADKALVEAEVLREQKHALESQLAELRSTMLRFQDEIAVLRTERDNSGELIRGLVAGQSVAKQEHGALSQLIEATAGSAGLHAHLDSVEQELAAVTQEQQSIIEVFCATPFADMNGREQPAAIQHLQGRLRELTDQRSTLTERVAALRRKLGEQPTRARGPVMQAMDQLGWQREVAEEQTALTRQRDHLAQALDALAAVDDGTQPEVSEQRQLLRERLDVTRTQLDTLSAAVAGSQDQPLDDAPDNVRLRALSALGGVGGGAGGTRHGASNFQGIGGGQGGATNDQLAELEALGYLHGGTAAGGGAAGGIGTASGAGATGAGGLAGGGGKSQHTAKHPLYGKQAENAPASVLDGALLDLVDRALQARSDLESLANELSHQAPLVERGFVSDSEVRALQIQLDTQERRLQILHTLIDGELGATEIELAQATEQEPVDLARLRRLEARLAVLHSVR